MKDKNTEILNHYGVKQQMIIWLEELSELQKCICKWSRKYEEWEGDISKELKKEFVGEIADVENSIEQMTIAIGIEESEIDLTKLFKADRQLRRMENENRDKRK